MRSRTIALMILHEALRRGLIGFVFGKVAATLWTPEYILFLPDDAGLGLIAVMVVCALGAVIEPSTGRATPGDDGERIFVDRGFLWLEPLLCCERELSVETWKLLSSRTKAGAVRGTLVPINRKARIPFNTHGR
jgi:hypothetical protein